MSVVNIAAENDFILTTESGLDLIIESGTDIGSAVLSVRARYRTSASVQALSSSSVTPLGSARLSQTKG